MKPTFNKPTKHLIPIICVLFFASCYQDPSTLPTASEPEAFHLEVQGAEIYPEFDPTISHYMIRISDGLDTLSVLPKAPYDYEITMNQEEISPNQALNYSSSAALPSYMVFKIKPPQSEEPQIYSITLMPEAFPTFEISHTGTTGSDFLFLGIICVQNALTNELLDDHYNFSMVMTNHGVPVWYMPTGDRAPGLLYPGPNNTFYMGEFDRSETYYFKKQQPSGSDFQQILHLNDEYLVDIHDIVFLSNGNTLYLGIKESLKTLIIGENEELDLMIPDMALLEFDAAGNLVFIWRMEDYIDYLDSVIEIPTTPGERFDYAHINFIDEGPDDTLLISSRHLNEVTHIDHATGDIIWRLGGKNSDFEFINDPKNGFSHQHAAQWVGENRILLFDNGNNTNPEYSRAVEYELNVAEKTATLVFSYEGDRPFSYGMGSVQRLKNGNTLICWGAQPAAMIAPLPQLTEVNPAGEKVLEITFPYLHTSYCAYRFDWVPTWMK